jgi:PKD repeat protein
VGLAAATATLLAAPAAGQAGQWADSTAFTPGTSAYNIHLATQPDGSATAAWLSVPGSTSGPTPHAGAVLYVQRSSDDGNATTPVPLATINPVGSDSQDPSPSDSPVAIAAGPGESSVVAWGFPKSRTVEGIALAFVSSGGTVTRQLDVAAVDAGTAVAVGVDDRGIATLAYDDGTNVVAAHVTPNGATTTTTLGGTSYSRSPAVGVTPAGIALVAWDRSSQVEAVRLDADGAIASGPQNFAVIPAGPLTLKLSPDASAAVVGVVDQTLKEVIGARLALTGPVLGSTFHTAPPPGPYAGLTTFAPALALSPNGTITAAATFPGPTTFFTVPERFAPGATTGTVIDAFAGDGAPVFPGFAAGSDGRVVFSWVSAGGAENAVRLRVMAADGTFGPVMHTGDVKYYAVEQRYPTAFAPGLLPFFTAQGEVRLGVLDDFPLAPGAVRVMALDDTPPATTVSVPASGTVGTPVALGATATDRHSIAGLAWDFGDGSSATGASVTHAYGAAGTYTVKLTATDGSANTTVVSRTLTIAAAPSTVITTPAPAPPVVASPAKKAANVVITKATRSGRKVTVTGTVAKTASGKVTIAYTQKVGGATITQRKTTKIVKARFTVTITVPSAVTKAKTAATVSVSYAGDSDTLKGTAKHVVSKAKKKKAKAKR